VLGALSITPPYLGPVVGLELDVLAKVEVVDHVVPGVLVAVCGMLAALLTRRDEEVAYGAPALGLTGLCFLAGLWQTATHAPLVLDGGGPAAPWDAVLLHSIAGPVILALALWLTLGTMRTAEGDSADIKASG
jgi:hypothetical protein